MKYILLIFILLLNIPHVSAESPEGYLVIPKISFYKSLSYIPKTEGSDYSKMFDTTQLGYGIGIIENVEQAPQDKHVILGHTPGGFEGLLDITMGDEIIVILGETVQSYIVYDTFITSVNNGSVLWFDGGFPEVVLITCHGKHERLVVKAK